MSTPADDPLRRAYEAGYAAARRGEEAAPGCTADAAGRAFLQGYVDGRASLQAERPA
jgi:hypothetical protein